MDHANASLKKLGYESIFEMIGKKLEFCYRTKGGKTTHLYGTITGGVMYSNSESSSESLRFSTSLPWFYLPDDLDEDGDKVDPGSLYYDGMKETWKLLAAGEESSSHYELEGTVRLI